MLALVLSHAVAAVLAPLLVRRLGPRAFLVLAAVPAVTVAWALAQTSRMLDGETLLQRVEWVPGLGLDLAFAMGPLQWLLVLVVSGVGVLVLLYCTWYFAGQTTGLVSFTSSFTAFVGAMLGLVWSDHLLVLYLFWELTTIFSFLLIGFDPGKRASRLAAIEALIVTTLGGLVMLIGMLLMARESGSYLITEILADPPSGTATSVAVWLVLVGALSKSAQVPFQFWLPGAMAAPTPVSAYLHSASMVKAGIFLVALLAPGFSDTPGWRPVLLTLGSATMLAGGWRALRQVDVKLLLAYGTVSQLGFLMVVVSVGSRTAALAGIGLVLAHAMFKSTLFLVVGIVDHLAGTRDLRELSGVGRRLPVLAVAAVLAGASMAGLPPLVGFVAKETMWTALLELSAGEVAGVPAWAGWAVLVALLVGSSLTVAYTVRFLWGALADKPGVAPTPLAPLAAPFAAAPVLLSLLGLGAGFAGAALTAAITPYADLLPSSGEEEYLALWHGLELPLLLSGLTIAAGIGLFVAREAVCRLQTRTTPPFSAEQVYRASLRGLDRLAVEVTGLVQRGSVSVYVIVILLVVLAAPGTAMVLALLDAGSVDVVAWDRAAQPVVGLVMVAAAVMTVRSRRRLRAVLLAGVTGYGCAVLFLLHGAPDIAATQVLVETVVLVVFVLVLRRLPEYFTDRPLHALRFARMALAAGVGVAVTGFVLVAGNARTAEPISAAFARAAYEFGYGRNVVNVTLVDIRAWDTFGEISVLVVAATGVASLIFLDSRSSGVRRVAGAVSHPGGQPDEGDDSGDVGGDGGGDGGDSGDGFRAGIVTGIETGTDGEAVPARTAGNRVFLPGPRTLSPDRRSIVFEVVTRLLFHSIVVFSVYLLLAGHNLPGGGFVAGMVTGLALMVRYLAGGRYELDEAAPIDAGVLIGTGLFVAALSGLGPVAFGGAVLQTADVYVPVPLLGEVHLVSSVGFDIGVYLVVVGLVLDLLRAFGARLDRQILQAERDAEPDAEPGAEPDATSGPTPGPTTGPAGRTPEPSGVSG